MTFYAVIDTNIVVSSMLKHDSNPGLIIDFVTTGTIIPLLNDEIINEYFTVLSRNKFGFDDTSIKETIDVIKKNAIYLKRGQTLETFIDKDDIVFFEIVLSVRSTMDAYLVTGNIKHYPIRSYIVTPKEMIDIIEKENGPFKGMPDNL